MESVVDVPKVYPTYVGSILAYAICCGAANYRVDVVDVQFVRFLGEVGFILIITVIGVIYFFMVGVRKVLANNYC